MIVLAFPDEAEAAGRLAEALGCPLSPIETHEFPDGEVLPRVGKVARRAIVYRSLDRPNGKIVPLLLAADAARRAGAERLELVCPYLCYLRQDAVFRRGEPLSRDVIAPLVGGAFDRVLTVDAHLHRTHDLSAVMRTPARSLSAAPALAEALAINGPSVVIGPDSESAPWAGALARLLRAELLVLEKSRDAERRVHFTVSNLDRVKGRRAILADDVASSGSTLLKVARMTREAGAREIDVAVTHAMFGLDVSHELSAAGVNRVVSTDSIRHPTNAAALAPLLASALQEPSWA